MPGLARLMCLVDYIPDLVPGSSALVQSGLGVEGSDCQL